MTACRPDDLKPGQQPVIGCCYALYPSLPCTTPTSLPTTRPPRDLAPTGLDFSGAFTFEAVFLGLALGAALVSRRRSARRERAANERIARRYR